jgi:predicted transcriptional regulator
MKGKNALLISVRPRFAEMIFAGTKTVELRRVRPRVKAHELVFMYVSAPTMALRGAFEVSQVLHDSVSGLWESVKGNAGLTKEEFEKYFAGKAEGYAIVIRNVWKLPNPVRLARLRKERGGFSPPQSYHYICRHDFARIAGMTGMLKDFLQ